MKNPRKMPLFRFVVEFPDGEVVTREWTLETIDGAPPWAIHGPCPEWFIVDSRSWAHPQDVPTIRGYVRPGCETAARQALGDTA